MKSFLEPWHLLLLFLAGWINHRQQDAVEYLRTENQILKEKLGKKRILLHGERNHQGLDNQLIESSDEVGCTTGEIACRERLGGMLRYYYRRAA
jgi:hypothetical protein